MEKDGTKGTFAGGAYWKQVKHHWGTTKGPIHHFTKLTKDLDVEWQIDGRWTHIVDIEQIANLVRTKARDKMWAQLSRQRHNCQGMETGRDDEMSEQLGKLPRDPLRKTGGN